MIYFEYKSDSTKLAKVFITLNFYLNEKETEKGLQLRIN